MFHSGSNVHGAAWVAGVPREQQRRWCEGVKTWPAAGVAQVLEALCEGPCVSWSEWMWWKMTWERGLGVRHRKPLNATPTSQWCPPSGDVCVHQGPSMLK